MTDSQRFYRVLLYLRERKEVCKERAAAYDEVVFAALHYALITEDELAKYYNSPAKGLPIEEITIETLQKEDS